MAVCGATWLNLNKTASAAATASARRVLPTPPGPVSVSSRTAERAGSSRAVAAVISTSRPMSGVGDTGSRTLAAGRVVSGLGVDAAVCWRSGTAAWSAARSSAESPSASARAATVWG